MSNKMGLKQDTATYSMIASFSTMSNKMGTK